MRAYIRIGFVVAVMLGGVGAGAAEAQVPERKGYAEITAQSAFGNVTTQSYGVEGGINVRPGLQVFVDMGRVRNVATEELGLRAEAIATGLRGLLGGATVAYKQPVTFVVGGPKFAFAPPNSRVTPYVVVGFGVARVSKNVTFETPTGTADQFVTLGSDLSGTETAAMLAAGGGLRFSISGPVVLDLQYRFGSIFSDIAVTVQRAGVGIGFEF